jgi:hypothetical protein
MVAGGKRIGAGLKKGHKFSPEAVQRRIARIKISEHIDKLERFIESAPEDDLRATHLSAIGLLLDRVAPRLSATELSGEVARPTVIRAPETVADSRTWLDKHGPERVDEPAPGKPN